MGTTHIITATGFWNGEQRKLYWGMEIPGVAQWIGPLRRARTLAFELPEDQEDAEEALTAARKSMLNKHLVVELRPAYGADTLGGCGSSSL